MAVLFQGQLNFGGKCLDHQGNQYAVPILATPNGSPSQNWTLYDAADGYILQADSLGWMGLDTSNLLISPAWKSPSSPQHWTLRVDGQLQAESGPGVLLPTADGSSVQIAPPPALPAWTFSAQVAPPAPPAPSPAPTTLKAIPVAMFGINNPNTQATTNDPWQLTGALEYWGAQLQKTGPVVAMPQGVGINPNYSGDCYVWATGSAPQGPMNADPNSKAWMISVGLNMPSGPTLTAAAAPGVALYNASAPMDSNWANAAVSARYRTNANSLTVNGVWAYTNQPQMSDTIYLRPGWEMTGSWYTWGSGSPGQVATWATDFPACFRRCVDLFRDVCSHPDANGKTTNLVVIFNPNGDYHTPAGINLDAFYPGDDHVDMVAIDIYDMPQWQGGFQADGVTPNLTAAQRFAQFQLLNLQAADAYAHAHGKQVGICEWAAGQGGDNPDFINGVASWAQSAASPIGVLGYWNGNADSGYNGNLNSFPNQKAAFIANFGA